MKASEFVATYKGRPASAWEAAVVELCRRGDFLAWPLVPLTVTAGSRTCVYRVATDYLTIGEPGDAMRMPLTPIPAQRIADSLGMLLPTRKMSIDVWRAAGTRVAPIPMVPNKGADLLQYANHDAAIEGELATGSRKGFVVGTKKDVVIGRMVRPGKVVIYGWYWPDDPTIHGPYMTDNLRASQPIQPLSDAHGDGYVDYSHGIRLVDGTCLVDGRPKTVSDVLADPELAVLLSDEGPLAPAQVRYPAGPILPASVSYGIVPEGGRRNPADAGLDRVRRDVLEKS